MTKFCVGQKVKIKRGLVVDAWYGFAVFVSGRTAFKGKELTIKELYGNRYLIEEDEGLWAWTDEMLDPVDSLVLDAVKKYYPTRVTDYLEGKLIIRVVNGGNKESINILRQMASTDGNLVIGYNYGELYV